MGGDRRAGFMLLEVLVAAVVAVLLITLLTQVAGQNRHRVELVRGTSGAMAVARSVLEESSRRDGLEAGERRGAAGVYRWTAVTDRLGEVVPAEPAAPSGPQAAANGEARRPTWTLYRIEVRVASPDGRLTTIATHRLGRNGA